MRFDRTYSLHHSYGYGCGREHVQNASALRDFVHVCTYASKTRLQGRRTTPWKEEVENVWNTFSR